MIKNVVRAAMLVVLATSLPAQATLLGAFPGRTVNAEENNENAVEAFYKSFEGSAIGVRLSHRYSPDVLVYADFAQYTLDADEAGIGDDLEGNAFGAGFMYFQPELVDGYDAAFSVSYHTGEISADGTSFSLPNGNNTINFSGIDLSQDVTEIAAQLIISSREPLSSNGLQWYAGAGVHRIDNDIDAKTPTGSDLTFNGANVSQAVRNAGDSETEFGVTAGVVLPTSFGHAYAAVENIDGNIFGIGLRYNLK